MANLYRCGGGGTKVYDLGTGSSFDIKTLYPKINYTKLTVDNFITPICSCSNSSASADYTTGYGTYTASASGGGFSLSKQYDATTGILTISGGSTGVSASIHGNSNSNSHSFSFGHSYMVIGKIRTS